MNNSSLTLRSLASLLPPSAEGGCARQHTKGAWPLWYRSLCSTYPTGAGGSPAAPRLNGALAVPLLLALLGCSKAPDTSIPAEPINRPPPAASQAQGGRTAFVNVSVIPMDSETVLENHTVIVSDGRIVSVLPTADTDVSQVTTVIDGAGKYLAPGLADMHAHPMTQYDLDLFLANGITFIRSMWGEPPLLEMRDAINRGELRGPRIYTSGRIVDGPPALHYGTDEVVDADSARAVLTDQLQDGYDWIKIYSNLNLEAFDAIASQAKSSKVHFAGHIPASVPAAHAMRAGMQTFEHLTGVATATTRDGVDVPARWAPEFATLAARIATGEVTMDQLFDSEKMTDLANVAAETGIWVVPTLVVLRSIGLSPAQMQAESTTQAYRHMSYPVKEFWKLIPMMSAAASPEVSAGTARYFEHEISQVGAFHQAGAGILAGTDAPNPFVYTGFSLVTELELFVEAGMTSFESVQTATTNVAAFLGESGETAVVRAGARADLVLLEANPLESVTAYRSIEGVMVAGQWLDRATLDGLLEGAVESAQIDATMFEGQQGWPTEQGEQIMLQAAYRRYQKNQTAGAERISTVQTANGGVAHLSHSRQDDGQEHTARLAGGAELSLSGSAADWLAIGSKISDLADGETRRLSGTMQTPDGLDTVEITVTRHPSIVITGHFYWSGCNPHDVLIFGPSTAITAEICWGGGFFSGWPIRIEVEQDKVKTTYRRFL